MEAPRLQVPPGACDCHIHIFEDRYPLAPTATYKPPHAPVPAYRKVQAALRLERVVVVQPSGYGFDNTCTVKAIAALGSGARGIAVVEPEVDDAELARLDGAGIRGVRYFMLAGGVLPWNTLEAMAARIAPYGWHINLQLDGRDLARYEDRLMRLPCDLVIDHNGKFLEPVGPDHPGFQALLRLLDSGRAWIKLAAPYETSKLGPPHYADVAAISRALVQANPERCIWASNWPFPNQHPAPSGAAMLDLLLELADDQAVREKILVSNPSALYRF